MRIPSAARQPSVISDGMGPDQSTGRDHSRWLWWVVVIAIPVLLFAYVYAVYPQAIAPSHLAACGGSFHGPGPTSDRQLDPIHGFQRVGTYRWAGVVAMPVWADATCSEVYLQLPGRGSAVYFSDMQG